ncbi:MAG: anti-sigma factor antagonist [Actinomycetia bacterium]|nr:anti-sigma factor antagonist [Actinomycetes bacterium]
MFRTELDRAIVGPNFAARTTADPGRAHRSVTRSRPAPRTVTRLRTAARTIAARGAEARRGGRVIAPRTPQPPQLGDEPPVYNDGVLRITRIPGPGPGSGSRRGTSPGYALAGEIDESTVRGLAGKLAELAADLDEVHLDLAALDYSDLAGLRVIVQLAAAGRRRVVLHQVPPHLRAILGIVGWDTAPGLELAP